MNKTLLWGSVAVVVILLIYLLLTKLVVIPFIGEKAAALIVGAIGAITGLFFRKKRTA